MCGLSGIVHADADREADAARLERMNAAIAHRGPDDQGIWREGPAGLAHARLGVLDPTPAARQPMHSPCGRYVLVYNGELYNFRELRAALEQRGHVFGSAGDTEALLAGYAEYGASVIERLDGIFAFAVWDRERRSLFLARDSLGVKPLYYVQRDGVFAFASELWALRAGGFAGEAVDPAALDACLEFLYVPEPDCIHPGVRKLRPGEQLHFESGRIRRERYWRPRFVPRADWTLDSAAEACRALLRDAVRRQRVSDVPLGAFLSGGVDSSAIAALLAEALPGPLRTFSIGFDDAHANELRFARSVAERIGAEHAEGMARPDLAALLPRMLRHFGEPFADSSALPTWLVSELARQRVTVALSGDGGDELFAGYTWLRRNLQVAQLRRAPAPCRAAALAILRRWPASPRRNQLLRAFEDASSDSRAAYRRRLSCFTAAERAALYQPEWAAHLQAQPPRDAFAEHAAAGAGLGLGDWMLRQDMAMYLPGDILTKVDRASMAHGLEVRVPMLDRALVDFALSLPFALKFHRGRSKRVLRHAVRHLLPREILERPKRGFAVPIDAWFRGPLARQYQETVLEPGACCHAWFKPRALQSLLERHRARRENLGHRLWTLLVIEHWARLKP